MKQSLQEQYNKEVVPYLQEKLGIKNVMAVPKITKITVSTGFGKAVVSKTVNERKQFVDYISNALGQITGQKPKTAQAKKSIAAFKLRAGVIVGCFVTLRGKRMYQFLEKMIYVVLPRQRDFRGIKINSISEKGDLTIGFKEYAPFPELKIEREKGIFGVEITITTTAKNKQAGIELLRSMGVPLEKA